MTSCRVWLQWCTARSGCWHDKLPSVTTVVCSPLWLLTWQVAEYGYSSAQPALVADMTSCRVWLQYCAARSGYWHDKLLSVTTVVCSPLWLLTWQVSECGYSSAQPALVADMTSCRVWLQWCAARSGYWHDKLLSVATVVCSPLWLLTWQVAECGYNGAQPALVADMTSCRVWLQWCAARSGYWHDKLPNVATVVHSPLWLLTWQVAECGYSGVQPTLVADMTSCRVWLQWCAARSGCWHDKLPNVATIVHSPLWLLTWQIAECGYSGVQPALVADMTSFRMWLQ